MKPAVLGLAGLAAALVELAPGVALADYCRTKSCDNRPAYDDVWQTQPDPACDRDAQGCLLEGTPLYWPYSCISYSVQKDGSPKQGIDYETAHTVVSQAFTTWQSADCGDGATPSFRVDDLSPAECHKPEYNSTQGNANAVMFRDSNWPYANSIDTLALTTITYNTENAQIYDADIELNSAQADFTVADDEVHDDLLAVVTHEVGHFLGLSHDGDRNATMYAYYSSGELHQRELYTTDVAGICSIFPPGLPLSTNACVPRHGLLRTCAAEETSGCNIAPGTSGSAGVLGVLLGLGAVRRVRRRRTAR